MAARVMDLRPVDLDCSGQVEVEESDLLSKVDDSSSSAALDESEIDDRRLQQRQKQIDYGKNTLG